MSRMTLISAVLANNPAVTGHTPTGNGTTPHKQFGLAGHEAGTLTPSFRAINSRSTAIDQFSVAKIIRAQAKTLP
jgi:hypothetical protein